MMRLTSNHRWPLKEKTSPWPVRHLATSTPGWSGWTPTTGPSRPTCPVSSSTNIPFLVCSHCIMCPQAASEVTSASLTGITGGLNWRVLHSLLLVGFRIRLRVFLPVPLQYYSSYICAGVSGYRAIAPLAEPEFDQPRGEQQQHPEVGVPCSGGSQATHRVVQKWRSTERKPR